MGCVRGLVALNMRVLSVNIVHCETLPMPIVLRMFQDTELNKVARLILRGSISTGVTR